jgi:hypothetical protein
MRHNASSHAAGKFGRGAGVIAMEVGEELIGEH